MNLPAFAGAWVRLLRTMRFTLILAGDSATGKSADGSSSSMHVVMVSRRFPPQIGGAERALGRLACGLAQRGHRVSVLCEARDRETAERVVGAWREWAPGDAGSAGVELLPLRATSIRFAGSLRWMQALRAALHRMAVRCDCFYVSMLKHGAYTAVGVGRRRGVPVVLRPSGTGTTGDVAWQQRCVYGRVFRRRCRNADALVAVSAELRDELAGMGYPKQKVQLIPGGVPIPATPYDPSATGQFRRQQSLPPDGPLAVYVGRFSPEKGLEELVAAWGRVVARAPRARLVLVGEGPLRERLERQVRDQGLDRQTRFCGPTNDPEPFLRAADLFVLPSHQEGMSNALLEAMALGLPVVASDILGNRAVASGGDCAVLVPARDSAQLAEALLELFADAERRRSLGRAARAHASAHHDLQRVVDAHAELFEQLRQARPLRAR